MNSGPLVLPLLPRLFTFLSELRLLCLLLALLELELEPRLLLVLLLRLLHRASQSVFDPSVATFASSQPSSSVSVKVDVKLLSRDYLECTSGKEIVGNRLKSRLYNDKKIYHLERQI